jgi:hypothetical protein
MSFTTAVAKIHKNLIDTFEKAADAAVKGSADSEQTWHDFVNACKATGHDTTDAAHDEVEKHMTKHWMDRGMSKAEADVRFGEKWKRIKNLGDTVLTNAPKVEAAAKYGWLKFVGGVTAIFAAAMVYTAANSGPSPQTKAALETLRRDEVQQEQVKRLNEIVISEEDFNIVIGGLEVPSAPTPVEQVAPAAAAPALPAPIAAAAALPVAVEVTTPAGTRTFETNIEQVYRNSPPVVREHLEKTVSSPPPPKITHGYDGPGITEDPISCFVRHCMSGGGDGQHKTFTVGGTPFGSATFSY